MSDLRTSRSDLTFVEREQDLHDQRDTGLRAGSDLPRDRASVGRPCRLHGLRHRDHRTLTIVTWNRRIRPPEHEHPGRRSGSLGEAGGGTTRRPAESEFGQDLGLPLRRPQFTLLFDSPGTFPYFCANHTEHTGTITVDPLPTCLITGADPLCAGATGNSYGATVSPSGGTVTYAWSILGNGSIVGSTTGSSVSVTAGATGSFTLTLNGTRNAVAFQCEATVTVNANPSAISGRIRWSKADWNRVLLGGDSVRRCSDPCLEHPRGRKHCRIHDRVLVSVNAARPELHLTLDVTHNSCPAQSRP
jgi:hypothetical protein